MEQLLAATIEQQTRITLVRLASQGAVPFVAKVHRVRTRRGKEYYVTRLTVPKDVETKLGLKGNDFLFLLAQQAQWYHMIDWTKMGETWSRLPDTVKAIVMASNLPFPGKETANIPQLLAGTFGAPALTSGSGSFATIPATVWSEQERIK